MRKAFIAQLLQPWEKWHSRIPLKNLKRLDLAVSLITINWDHSLEDLKSEGSDFPIASLSVLSLFEGIQKLSLLEHLKLWGFPLDSQAGESLAHAIEGFSNLKSFRLCFRYPSDNHNDWYKNKAIPEIFKACSGRPQLEVLELESAIQNRTEKKNGIAVIDIMECQSFAQSDKRNSNLQSLTLEELLPEFKQLKSLSLWGLHVNSVADGQKIGGALQQLGQIEHLKLTEASGYGLHTALSIGLANLKQLKTLKIEEPWCRSDGRSMQSTFASIHLGNLETLCLDGLYIEDFVSLVKAGPLTKCPALKKVSLSTEGVYDFDVEDIMSSLAILDGLEEFHLALGLGISESERLNLLIQYLEQQKALGRLKNYDLFCDYYSHFGFKLHSWQN